MLVGRLQVVAQSVEHTPRETEVTSSNPSSPSYVDMSKKKKKMPVGQTTRSIV
jgi:hypothetical protein